MQGANWATWKFVNSVALDPLSVGTVFSVPPRPVNAASEDLAARWPWLPSATDATYRESGTSLMEPPGQADPRYLQRLHDRGARMVLFHGVSDAIFSAEDTRQWLLRADRVLGRRADQVARYFPVPGMNHCSGGPAADQVPTGPAPLVDWVERGVPPQAVTTSVSAAGAGNAGRREHRTARRLVGAPHPSPCAYPTVARYKGSGDLEDAASFSCQ